MLPHALCCLHDIFTGLGAACRPDRRAPATNGRLAPGALLQRSGMPVIPGPRPSTRIRCVCGMAADRGRMIQCQVGVLSLLSYEVRIM